MDRFGPTGKVSKKRVHLLRWSSFPGRTGWNFGWMDRAQRLFTRGFRFRSRRVGLWPTKLLVAREKKPLVPRVLVTVYCIGSTIPRLGVGSHLYEARFVMWTPSDEIHDAPFIPCIPILMPTRSRMKAWHTNWLADFMSGGSDPKTTTP